MRDDLWWLAVDFGTSNTAAAHARVTDGAIAPVPLTHRSNLLPSAVFVRSVTDILTGDAALNAAAGHPKGLLPSPKRLVGQPLLRAGAVDVTPAQMIAAVLTTVVRRAATLHDGLPPQRVVLTHPEAWPPGTVAVLVEAAARAGIDPGSVTTVSEPRAAAHHYTRAAALPPGTALAVFDFGGGTADVAVLRATGAGSFTVVAARGDDTLGGKNIDARIRRWALERTAESDPALHARLTADPDALRALDGAARDAKEVLSDAPTATVAVGSGAAGTRLLLTRDEFDALVAPEVDTAVELVRATLRDAGVGPDALHALYLTGGSSRVPLVHRALAQLARVATLDDPKTVVAQGALLAAHRAETGPPPPAGAAPPAPPVPGPSPRGRRRTPVYAGATAALVVVAGAAGWAATRPDGDPAVLAHPSTVTVATTVTASPTASPTAPAPPSTTPAAVSPTSVPRTSGTPTSRATPTGAAVRPAAVTVTDADAQGFVGGAGPRCNHTNEAVAVARTTESLIVVCRTGVDRLYYKGMRAGSGSAIEIDDPVPVAGGYRVGNAGVIYAFDGHGLSITEGDTELAYEPMVEYWTRPR